MKLALVAMAVAATMSCAASPTFAQAPPDRTQAREVAVKFFQTINARQFARQRLAAVPPREQPGVQRLSRCRSCWRPFC